MNKNFSFTTGVLFVILIAILGLLCYDVFKEPAVTRETINKLQASVDVIENYTRELQTLGTVSKQKIIEEDLSKKNSEEDREKRYNELLNKYGVFKGHEKLINFYYDANFEYYHERMYPKS